MSQGIVNTVVSAVVGGIVGAAVVFFASGNKDNLSVENLKVAKLTITKQAALLNNKGTEDVVLRDGSIFAENLIFASKFMGKQFQGPIMVANRMLTTPDNVMNTPMEQWRFFTEMGSYNQRGGEMIFRSNDGPALVNKPTHTGALLRVGFDTDTAPQVLGLYNPNKSEMSINNNLTDAQKKDLAKAVSASGQQPGVYNGATTPVGGQGNSSVASQGNAGTAR